MAKKNVVLATADDLHIKVVRPARAAEATHALVSIETPPSQITEAEMRDLFAPALPVWFNQIRDGVMHAENPLQAWRGLQEQPCCRHSVGEAGMPDPELWLEKLENLGCPDSWEHGLERAARLLARWVAVYTVPQTFVLSAQIVPIRKGEKAVVEVQPLSVKEAKNLLDEKKFVSAVGHAGTAEAISALLGMEIPQQRLEVFLRPGDEAIQFVLARRQPEGTVLDRKAVEEVGFSLSLVRRLK